MNWSLQEKFAGLINRLKSVTYDLLNPKETQWTDDFAQFKAEVKDLEIMFNGVIFNSYDNISSLTEKLGFLEIAVSLAKTETVTRAVLQRISGFYQQFMNELETVKKVFEEIRRHPSVDALVPQNAGSAR